MNSLDLQKPSRQSPVGVAVIFFKNLRTAINVFISVVVLQLGFKGSFFGMDMYTFGIIIAFIFLVISFLQYRKFFFYVQDDKFVIEKGLIKHDKITIPFDRIQTVNINQNVVQQLLGVVALIIDTAGSATKEMEISALPKAYARELQEYLMEKRKASGEGETAPEDISPSQKAQQETLDISDKKPLVKLGVSDLLRVGLTENHLRTGIIIFAVINGYLWQYEEYLLKPFEPYLEKQADVWMAQYMIIIPAAILLFLVISILLSLIQTVLKYFQLEFFVDKKGVQLVSGLLKRAEYQIPVNKIQYLKWKSNPLRKLIGLKTLLIKQASSQEAQDKQNVKIPGCKEHHLNIVLNEFYPEREESDFYELRPHNLMFVQLISWMGIIPSLALAALWFVDHRLALTALLYAPLSVIFIVRYANSVKLRINREMIMLAKGWVYPSVLALKFYKLQTVTFSQSIFQEGRALASITFHTAAGDETMPHIPVKEARAIYDYSLYKIESSGQSWM